MTWWHNDIMTWWQYYCGMSITPYLKLYRNFHTFFNCSLNNILLISFFLHPELSLTPGAFSQIHCLISSLILWYTTGSLQQPGMFSSLDSTGLLSSLWLVPESLWNLHLLNTPATIILKWEEICLCLCLCYTVIQFYTYPQNWITFLVFLWVFPLSWEKCPSLQNMECQILLTYYKSFAKPH